MVETWESLKEGPMVIMINRRDELLAKLRANEISKSEAIELNDLLIREKKEAEDRNDTVALIAVVLGLALLASVLAKKG